MLDKWLLATLIFLLGMGIGCKPSHARRTTLRSILSQIMRVALFSIVAALLVGCATTSDPVDRLVTKLSSSHGLWRNGEFAILGLPATASTEQVVARVFQMDGFEPSQVAKHRILKVRKVRIPGDDPDIYTAVVIDTDFGRKIVLLKYQGPAAGWWSRIYDADTSA